jgi:P27 family predicted phage terminase small subunit
MGVRGPLPISYSLPTARGTNTFFANHPVDPPDAEVPPPTWLDAAALAVWMEKAPPLIAAGRLRASMATAFAVFCQLAVDCDRYSREVAEEGTVIASPRGAKANPKVRLLRDARRDLLAYSRAFGLDPSSAARLPAPPTSADMPNPLAEFIARRPK